MSQVYQDTPPLLLSGMPHYVKAMVPYRPGKPLEELKEEYGFDKVIKLASNENPFGASPKALKAAAEGLNEVYRYPDPVSRKLRRQIAERLGIHPDEIVVGAGSESLLATTVRTLLAPGDVALCGEGAFMGFSIHMAAHGGRLIQVPSPNYKFNVEGMISALTPEVRIVYLPNPNNPTGSYITTAELTQLIEALPPSTLLLLDEAYVEFCQNAPDYPNSLALRRDNVLILRTFSKAYGLAGFRIGYGIGHPKLIEQLGKVKMTFEPSLPAQLAAQAAWEDDAFLTQTVENNQTEMQRYYQTFDRLGIRYVRSQGNFVLLECGSAERVLALNEGLLKQGIAIRPLGPFGFPECARISIGLPAENDAVFTALESLWPMLPQG